MCNGIGDFLKGMTKYIFITGGVVSSLNGVVTSSLASLLELSKFNLRLKLDPYLIMILER